MTNGPVLELNSISKRFGPVVACDRVDLAVAPGEIVGLLGQNGAGKSTLMKIVLGLVPPDAGEVRVGGEAQIIRDPTHAASLGIAMVHQHFSVIDAFTVWENVHLGAGGSLDPRKLRTDVAELSAAYDLVIDPDARVGDLNASQRQRLEIIKCLRRDPSVIILDEPTSVLTLAESRRLFEVLRRMVADQQRAVVLISHKLDEILHATDRVAIMRDGRVVSEMPTSAADAPTLARAMVGREVSLRNEASALGILGELTATGDADGEADEEATRRPMRLPAVTSCCESAAQPLSGSTAGPSSTSWTSNSARGRSSVWPGSRETGRSPSPNSSPACSNSTAGR